MPIIFLIIVGLDQASKYLAFNDLRGQETIHLLGEFLNLTYVENRGAAFGILENQRVFFIATTVIILLIVSGILAYKKGSLFKLTEFSLYLIAAGAIGNLIDRIRLGYVIDFIDVRFGEFYNFPVFNIADMSVVIGTFIVAILIFFDRYEVE